ncbi:heterokaryon incompatibility protein-domain-containing protein [Leptodontidium sp. 2 PMI_412]|nr:heterokaryon incompatibility protein-domain-containing protein [Leptodontidium sp. 2 PMI_412]
MRLFSTQKVQFVEVYGSDVPSYAILSHTWSDGEILLQTLERDEIHDAPWSALSEDPPEVLRGNKAKGFKKVLRTTEIARRNGYDLLWVDTCCIDKTSSAELSEAINSMYRWYGGAEVCYAYLSDVPAASTESPFEPNSKFRRSRWFNRGWTLQELIASKQVEIFASDWSYLGAKTGDMDFTKLLSEITGIQLDVLLGELSPQDMSIAARMHWAAERQTTRVEDIAYCLLGIFDVNMPLLYGEGKRAFIRLQEAILTKEEDQSLFAWHSELLPTSTLGDIGQTGGISGLLADSPDWFSDDNEIETSMPMILKSSPSAVTSKGLRVDFLLLPCTEDQPIAEADFRVVLNCERLRDGQRESPVIYLKRIWGMGDQFARVRPDLKHFTPPVVDVLDVGIHERVFIKQDPWSDMRTIRIVAAKDGSQLQLPSGTSDRRVAAANWKIKDAWPRKGWAENMQTFQTREFTFGIPCGVLRLEINESGQPTTVDVAVGMHAPSERLSRSWCQ